MVGPDQIMHRQRQAIFLRHRAQDHQHLLQQFVLLDLFVRARGVLAVLRRLSASRSSVRRWLDSRRPASMATFWAMRKSQERNLSGS